MGLINEVPNVKKAIGPSDKDDSRSSRRPAPASMECPFANHALEDGSLEVYFPDGEMEVVHSQYYVLVAGAKFKCHCRSVGSLLVPIVRDWLVL